MAYHFRQILKIAFYPIYYNKLYLNNYISFYMEYVTTVKIREMAALGM